MSQAAPNPVWISGIGAISCLGANVGALWSSVLENRTGIRTETGLGPVPLQAENVALEFCRRAISEAMTQAGWKSLEPTDGVVFATTTGNIQLWDEVMMGLARGERTREEFAEVFVNQPLGTLMQKVCEEFGQPGPRSLLTSACSAATQALGIAAMWIRQGRVKRCLVVGVEVLCPLTIEGFRSLQLLANGHCQPFDAHRRGINLSEGAAVICLEASCAAPLARLSGFGFSTDGFHMTGPHPEGDGSFRSMSAALAVAKLEPRDITWMHAHGTGSAANDLSEGLAAKRLFGDNMPPVSSTKWLHGHALGASGALETALVVECIRQNRVLFTRGLTTPDPKIPLQHLSEDRLMPIKHVLKNTLGFGGSNASLVISHPAEAIP